MDEGTSGGAKTGRSCAGCGGPLSQHNRTGTCQACKWKTARTAADEAAGGNPIGPWLRKLRTDRRLTQEELAGKSGVNISTIRQLETGRRTSARIGTLGQLATALGVETAELLGPAGSGWSPQDEQDREFGARVRGLLGHLGMSGGDLVAVLAGVPGPSGTVPGYRLLEFMTGELRALRAEVRALAPGQGRQP